ncbi:MAG: glycosyltransferase [Desulfobacterota bacterium]|nr:glycosyltransferase [Thermodesulfobacteriota bacterium]MDW8001216.1 glycosyltransferase [Deltaproteobacteria bacterium]
MNPQGTISVLVVTKDTPNLLSRLITSILEDRELFSEIRELIVVDNGSDLETEEIVKRFSIGIKYLRQNRNLGFAKAVNLGASISTGKYLLLLNSDILLPKGEILKLKKVMDSYPNIAVSGPSLIYPDGSFQRSYSHVPSLLVEIVPRFVYEALFTNRSRKLIHSDPLLGQIFEVESLIGACLMIRRSTFERLGGFDERFFFFFEETDFCLRVKKIEGSCVFVPSCKVIHDQGMTVRKVWVLGRLEYNISLLKFIRKHYPVWYSNTFVFVRFLKTLLGTLLLLGFFPVTFLSEKRKRILSYYLRTLFWFLKGLPDDYGLKSLIFKNEYNL